MENLEENLYLMMKPFQEMQEKLLATSMLFQNSIRPIVDETNRLTEVLLSIQKSFENVNVILNTSPVFKNPFLGHIEVLRKIGENLKNILEKTPEHFLLIAQHGWFIDLEGDLNFASNVAYYIEHEELEVANKILEKYYKENLEDIFKKLFNRHPNRQNIFKEILKSFKNKNYNLLVPTVLTQVDGICFDFTKKKFFIKERRNNFLPEVTSELESSIDKFLYLFLSPLQNQIPIMAREKDIYKFPCQLNRHKILHGISTDYGNEINSLKVISLLKYLSDLLTDLDEKIIPVSPISA